VNLKKSLKYPGEISVLVDTEIALLPGEVALVSP
jgi:hypothetical protein